MHKNRDEEPNVESSFEDMSTETCIEGPCEEPSTIKSENLCYTTVNPS